MTNTKREDAIAIFNAAVKAVQPSWLMKQHIHLKNSVLKVCDSSFILPSGRPVWIFGAGKAAASMAAAIEDILADVPLQGMIITKYEHALPLQHIQLREAAHPVPDENGVRATQEMIELLKTVQSGDIVLFLLSGGASALLADYPPGADLEEVQEVFGLLLKSGANIHEMNVVRKHLSTVKGGQLVRYADTNMWCSLILSDVVGDDLSIIGSGPTVADPSTFSEAVAVLDKYALMNKLPQVIHTHLQKGLTGSIAETPKPGDPQLSHVNNFIIGSNHIALEAAQRKAIALGYTTQLLTSTATGNAMDLAADLVAKAKQWKQSTPACLLMGGESTVTVTGNGSGGRNQHLVLAAVITLHDTPGITILSAGTDGTDGPTDAAGAVADCNTMQYAAQQGIKATNYLDRHDAYHFFEKAGGLIKTGPTQTNVMDIMLALIY